MKALFVHVPKTGGNTIRRAFEGHVAYNGHQTAEQIRDQKRREALGGDQNPLTWSEAWKFAFVRNPWDRAASLYYWSRSPVPFGEWCRNGEAARILRAENRSAESLLCDRQTGELLVDDVFRFEVFALEFGDIVRRLGADHWTRIPHLQRNPTKPPDLNYRELYSDWSRGLVEGLCQWEIQRFEYEF